MFLTSSIYRLTLAFGSQIKPESEGKSVDGWRQERYRLSTALVDWLSLIMRKVYSSPSRRTWAKGEAKGFALFRSPLRRTTSGKVCKKQKTKTKKKTLFFFIIHAGHFIFGAKFTWVELKGKIQKYLNLHI